MRIFFFCGISKTFAVAETRLRKPGLRKPAAELFCRFFFADFRNCGCGKKNADFFFAGTVTVENTFGLRKKFCGNIFCGFRESCGNFLWKKAAEFFCGKKLRILFAEKAVDFLCGKMLRIVFCGKNLRIFFVEKSRGKKDAEIFCGKKLRKFFVEKSCGIFLRKKCCGFFLRIFFAEKCCGFFVEKSCGNFLWKKAAEFFCGKNAADFFCGFFLRKNAADFF